MRVKLAWLEVTSAGDVTCTFSDPLEEFPEVSGPIDQVVDTVCVPGLAKGMLVGVGTEASLLSHW